MTASGQTDGERADPAAPRPSVAVLGLGSMGLGMATALLRAGFPVRGFDPTAGRAEAFRAAGGETAASPAAAADGAACVVSVVVNAAQTEAVLFGEGGCAGSMAEGGVFVSCATVAPEVARALAARLGREGRRYLDAPMSGGSVRAAEGALTMMLSGTPDAVADARPVLDAMCSTVHVLGNEAGPGSAFKMVNQLLAGVHVAAACEAIAFAAREGLDLRRVYEVISGAAGNSWMFGNRVPHVLDGDYAPYSTVEILIKDLGIILDMARARQFPVPVAGAALQMFLMAGAAGMGKDDDSSVTKVYAKLAGLELPTAAGAPGE
ncbi:MAG: NAD-binding protein [Gluconacetobacter diazotrophicus]|nr:NAD-binding protein [Gluconacetobacter diazotrophicus]